MTSTIKRKTEGRLLKAFKEIGPCTIDEAHAYVSGAMGHPVVPGPRANKLFNDILRKGLIERDDDPILRGRNFGVTPAGDAALAQEDADLAAEKQAAYDKFDKPERRNR